MKKIFTYPNNSSSNYIHLDDTQGADMTALEFMESIHDGNYISNNFSASPASSGAVTTAWGRFYKYVDQKKSGANVSRHDFWRQPIIQVDVTGNYLPGVKLINPTSDRTSTDAARFEIHDGSAHNLRDGAIMYTFKNTDSNVAESDRSYSLATGVGGGNESQHYCKVISATQFEIYDSCTYDADGVAQSFSNPITPFQIYTYRAYGNNFVTSPGFQTNWELYDTFPQVMRSPMRDSNLRVSTNRANDANSGFVTNWKDSATDEWLAPFMAIPDDVRDADGVGDVPNTRTYYLNEYDSEWIGIYDTPFVNTNYSGSDYQMPGKSNQINDLSYSPTFDYTVSADTDGRALFTKNTGNLPNYDNGHPLNLTRADSFRLLVGDRAAPRGGTGITWFIHKKNNNSFWLTAQPYRTATEHTYAKYVSEANVTNRWHQDSQSASVTANAADIRFSSVVDTSFKLRMFDYSLQINVTNATAETYDWKFLETKISNTLTYGTTHMTDMGRVLGNSWFDPLPYRVTSVELVWPGNAQYGANGSGSLNTETHYVEGQETPVVLQTGKGQVITKGGINVALEHKHTAPTVTYTTDSNGYMNSVTLTDGGRLGWAYNGLDVTGEPDDPKGLPSDLNIPSNSAWPEQSSGQMILYQPPAESVPQTVSNNDRHLGDKSYDSDSWMAGIAIASAGGYETNVYTEDLNKFQHLDGRLYWPDHIAPRSANITVTQPSSVNNSASGIKYVRNSGFVRYSLDLEYPPMKEEHFARFLGFVNGMRGQTVPFRFPLQFINRFTTGMDGILFNTPNNPDHPGQSPRLWRALAAGDKRMYLEGYESNQTMATQAGQHFQLADSNRNGGLHTSLLQQNANGMGQVIVNMAYPAQISSSIGIGTEVNDNPKYVTVSLNADDFVYKTDYSGLYTFSVEMTFDERKD